jgi:hypothetical protein
LQRGLIKKNFNDETDDLLETFKTNETQEITADDLTKTTMVLYVGQVEVKEAVTYKAKVMRRHGETLQFAFSDKDNISEIEREDIVVKIPRPISCGTARTLQH